MSERKRPVAGIGFGQRGYWGNRHFSSVELARAAFERYLAEVVEMFSRPDRRGGPPGRYVVVDIPIGPGVKLLRHTVVRNLKKNGKPGKIAHHIQLYPMDQALADRFLKDPRYCVEA